MTDALNGFALMLVDDHPLFREGMALALGSRVPGLVVVPVDSGARAEALLLQDPQRFDLVVLDQCMPGPWDGLAWAARLRLRFPVLACALMSGLEDEELPFQARDAGLAAFLPKSLDVTEVLQALDAVARGCTWFPARVVRPYAGPALTLRQMEIVELAARGATSKEIGRSLGISPATVRNHFAQIFERLGAKNRAQAVRLAWHGSTGGADDTPNDCNADRDP